MGTSICHYSSTIGLGVHFFNFIIFIDDPKISKYSSPVHIKEDEV